MNTTTEPISPHKLKCLNTLVSKLGLGKDAKEAMVAGFSNGRCTSSRDLWDEEGLLMIKHLQKMQGDNQPDPREKMRRNIIAMAHEMGWKTGGGKADMDKINKWCERFGKANLNDYSYAELPKLVYAFKQVLNHYLNSI